jgi:hypothetical protein
VLPTPAKCFLPDYLKNSAAGEKIRPHTLCCIVSGLIDVNKDSKGMVIGKKAGNSADFQVFFFNVSKIFNVKTENHTPKKFGRIFCHFLSNLQKIRPRIFSAAEIFLGPLVRFAAEISARLATLKFIKTFMTCAVGTVHNTIDEGIELRAVSLIMQANIAAASMQLFIFYTVSCTNSLFLFMQRNYKIFSGTKRFFSKRYSLILRSICCTTKLAKTADTIAEK